MKKMNKSILTTIMAAGITFGAATGPALADDRNLCYEVTITNMTQGQVFTPVLVATHKKGVQLFTEGEPASFELAQLAEGGDVVPLAELLETMPSRVGSIAVSEGGPFAAGESVTVKLPASKRFNRMSLASMLAITNDGFIALNGVRTGKRTNFSPVYDAGSEVNDELAAHIPGPGGEGYNPEDGEGFVHIHAGMHSIGDLYAPETLDWRNPAAKITSRLVRCEVD